MTGCERARRTVCAWTCMTHIVGTRLPHGDKTSPKRKLLNLRVKTWFKVYGRDAIWNLRRWVHKIIIQRK